MYTSPDTTDATSLSRATAPVVVVLIAWFALILLLGTNGGFVTPAGTPPLPLLVGFLTPLIAFVAAYRGIGAFRDFVLSLDPRLAAAMQAWRFAGFEFIALAVHRVLPILFAWQAGLGDMAIGITAPWVVLALIRRPRFATSPLFVVWNLLGILDLVAAVSTGALSGVLASGGAGEVTTTAMSQLPLVLIPAFFVPVFFMLHLAALFQVRQSQASQLTTVQPERDSTIAA